MASWGEDTACYLPTSVRSRQCLLPILIFNQPNQTFYSFQVVSQKASKYVRNVLKASEAQFSGEHEVNSFAYGHRTGTGSMSEAEGQLPRLKLTFLFTPTFWGSPSAQLSSLGTDTFCLHICPHY